MECEEDVAKLLRKGDTWVHMYQLSGQTILNHEGKIKDVYSKTSRNNAFKWTD